jgi:hypothetical protein
MGESTKRLFLIGGVILFFTLRGIAKEINQKEKSPPRVKPILTALKTGVLPGWGQFSNRKYFKGILSIILQVTTLSLCIAKFHTSHRHQFRQALLLFLWTWYFCMLDAYVDSYFREEDQKRRGK